jgi:hypothetical protein
MADYDKCRRSNIATHYPSCLYDIDEWLAANNDHINTEDRNPKAGLLRSKLLIMVSQYTICRPVLTLSLGMASPFHDANFSN